ncbi:MAG: small conductance mechanosensitive channel [Candidatus Nanohaloarchaea archaeon]|jgi:small conductance mechanosensitive channel
MIASLNTDLYVQLALFFASIIFGVGVTRTFLMPAAGRVMERRDGDIKAVHSVQNIVGLTGLFVTFTVALQIANFGNLLTVLGTIAAAATVAIGFGMRDQISSLVAGIFIHTDNPYVKGDYISIDDHEGVVQEVKLRATVIESNSHPKQVIPNNLVTTKTLKNYTKGRKTRKNIRVKVGPEKADKASEILQSVVESDEEVWKKPAPSTDFKSVEDDKMVVESSFWISNPKESRRIKDKLLRSYSGRAAEEGLFEKES